MAGPKSSQTGGSNWSSLIEDALVGFILFVSCSYILVLNPAILSGAGFSAPNVFTATALAAGLGSIFMGLLSRAPSVVAPGMGLNGFIAAFCGLTILPWQGVAVLMFGACLLHWFVFVLTGKRKIALDALQNYHVMAIITSSIGGMVLRDAFVVGNLLPNTGNPIQFVTSFSPIFSASMRGPTLLFCGMTIVVMLCYAVLRDLAEKRAKAATAARQSLVESGLYDFFAGVVLLASVPLSALIANTVIEAKLPPMDIQEKLALEPIPFTQGISQIITAMAGTPYAAGATHIPSYVVTVPLMLVFVLTAVFVLLIDAPGTPYLLLQEQPSDTPTPESKARAEAYPKLVSRGFHVEALAGLGCVLFQGSPAVCYAESNFAKELRVLRGTPAVICGVLFLLVLFAAWRRPVELHDLAARIPLISLSPLLATIAGIIMMAGLAERRQDAQLTMLDQFQRYGPRLIAAGGAFIGLLSIGVALGIVFEWLVAAMRRQQRDGMFDALALLSLIALITTPLLIVASSH